MNNIHNVNEKERPEKWDNRWYFRGEIYYANIGEETEGHEQKKRRPVVIVQNNLGNRYSPNVIVASISSTKAMRYAKKPQPTQMPVSLAKDSVIICEQLRTISKKRLEEKVGELTSNQMAQLDSCLMCSLGLKWIS